MQLVARVAPELLLVARELRRPKLEHDHYIQQLR